MFPEHSLMANVILSILAIMVLLVFVGIVYAVVYSVFMFIFSWWNEEKIKKAWNSIRYAILWLILTLFILFAIPWFLRTIKVPWYKNYTAWNIFKTAKGWLNRVVDVFNNTQSPLHWNIDDYQL
jgi:ABC-type Fe3+ transport system permease subunit